MRVLYFSTQDSPHNQRFLTALATCSEHEVFYLRMVAGLKAPVEAQQTPDRIIDCAWPEGQPDWTCWPGWQDGAHQLRQILTDLNPDLVHAGPIQGPALLTAISGFHPLVSMSWGFDLLRDANRSPWMRYATEFALSRTDVLLADCQTVVHRASQFGFPQKRVVVFPWGVDLNHFAPDRAHPTGAGFRRSLGWQDQCVVCCNRSWSALYGVELLARAFVDASHQVPQLRLLLAGGGPQSDLFHRILEPVQDRVHFPGWISYFDLPGFYGAGDLFVSPSRCDGSSVSLMEALACGCPVLVSDITSNREWVQPGVVGDLFSDGDVSSLTSQLVSLASDSNLGEYGQRARKLAETRADWQKNFQKLLVAYQLSVEA